MRTLGEFLFSEEKNSDTITLKPTKGSSMKYSNFQGKFESSDSSLYGQQDITVIDFPGEYDIHGHAVTCYATGDLLHYIITVDDKRYAIVQDTQVLAKETFDQIDVWVVADESIQQYIEREELDGKVELIEK